MIIGANSLLLKKRGGIPDDYVARYLFEGDYSDESGTYNGTNSGSSFVGAGNGPNGSDFGIETGAGAYVELGSSLPSALGGGAGTISFVIKTLSASEAQVVSSSNSSSINQFYAIQSVNGTTIRGNYVATNLYESDTDYSQGTWSHCVIRTNGSITSFRVNGINATKTVPAGSDVGSFFNDPSGINRLTVGQLRRSSPVAGASFQIALLTLYNRSISDAECAQLESEY